MKIKLTSTFKAGTTLNRIGLGKSNYCRIALASKVKEFSATYAPHETGELGEANVSISSDGSEITYASPYAHYHYHGIVMAGKAPKHYTGAKLQHRGAPTRGPHWDKRMVADHRHDLENEVVQAMKKYMNGGL